MPQSPPTGPQRLTPYLAYDDAPAAIEFLCAAFGFEEGDRIAMPDGRVGHAELHYGGTRVLMLASTYPEMGHASPQSLPAIHSQVHCLVDDVDAHHARARAAGATISSAPSDQPHGDRTYRAVDPEGHHWMFAAPLQNCDLEDSTPPPNEP